MGNCIPRNKKSRRNSRGRNGSSNCSRSIKDGERQMVTELQEGLARGGVSFTIGVDNGAIPTRLPRRLQKLKEVPSLEVSVHELDEKQLKAKLLREEKKANRTLKARQDEFRRQDALQRRETECEKMKEKIEAKEKEHVRRVEDRRKKLQELALKTREARLKKANKAV